MAIRIRRGLYDDFDSTKMLPGEWAVAIDSDTSKQVVWMCFAPGVVKRMGTYEDFKQQIEEATAEIKDEYLTEFQTILDQIDKLAESTQSNTDTVIQIRDTTVNTYLPQMLKYLENAQAASKTATEQATSASTSATNAKTSETLAKSYMERAFSATPEGYDALVDNVNMLDIQTTTDATLYGSKSGGLRVNHMVGNTEQRTLSGVNHLNPETLIAGDYNGIHLDTRVSQNVKDRKTVKVGDRYTVAWDDPTLCFFAIITDESNNMILNITSDIHTSPVTIPINADGKLAIIFGGQHDISTGAWGEITLEQVKAANPRMYSGYEDLGEPYCGNQPSPNPEYPQSIHNTGDCVEMIQGYYDYLTGVYSTNDNRICNKHSIPCNAGDTINLSVEDVNTVTFIYYNKNGYVSYTTGVTGTEHIVPSGVTSFNLYIFKESGLTTSTVGKIQLTINGKYVVQIVEHGKNQIKPTLTTTTKDGVTLTNNGDGTYTLNGTVNSTDNTQFHIYVKPENWEVGKKYRLVGCPKGGSKETYYLNALSGATGYDEYGDGITYEITDTTKTYLTCIIYIYNGVTVNNLVFKPMLVDADLFPDVIYDDFESYTESTATILLDEPLRDEDLIVNVDGVWQVERHKKKVIYNASDFFDTPNAYDNVVFYLSMKPTDMLGYNTYNTINMLSNKFIRTTKANLGNTYDTAEAIGKLLIDAEKTTIWFGFKKGTTLEEAQSIGEIELQYKLATPTYEILDTASQIALNSLKTFDTVTHITVDSVTQPAELEVEFGKSKVGAYTLKSLNDNDIDRIERAEMKAQLNELATALVAVGSEV